MLALALPLGLLIGLSLGALGGGGSILTVPALVYVLGQSPVAATTGSLIIVGVTSLTGMVAHARAGRVRVAQGLLFGVLGVAGSWYGSHLSASVAPAVLLAAFSVLMLVVAGIMIARQRHGRRGADCRTTRSTRSSRSPPASCATAPARSRSWSPRPRSGC